MDTLRKLEMTPAQRADMEKAFVLIVAVNSDNVSAGFGVMRKVTFDKWNAGYSYENIPDAFGLLYGGCDACDTFDIFHAAQMHIAECDGVLVDVIPTLAY